MSTPPLSPMDPRYSILFEPIRVGPVTAPNRFYQTPHATGLGTLKPLASAALRSVKAEGGWGVVSTEYCSIHPSSDDTPYGFLSLWDEADVRVLGTIADAIHAHGSLSAVELWHGGNHSANRYSREPLLSPSGRPGKYMPVAPVRAMDKADIRAFRQWQRSAALRARQAGFDIVYVYAGHDYLPFQFLSRRSNARIDEYGGRLENRARLLREMIEDTKEAVGASCGVAVRLAVDELLGAGGVTAEGEGREVVEMLAELPDLWDVNLAGGLGNDSTSARFSEEGFQEKYVAFVKSVTTKPVVSVGRFTSPERMVSQIRRGIQDFIGAARPSIADPFLPRKILEGREDEIRECIGCNICRSANNEGIQLRCTQNPTMGEEWRRKWHPERIPPRHADEAVLVVGGGPAGLEASLALARRGYDVTLAEAENEFGGRLRAEARLPGLATWMRVRDHRLHMLGKLPNAKLFPASRMSADDVVSFGAQHVVLATGSHWRRDGIGVIGDEVLSLEGALTPDDLLAGAAVQGPVVIFDDEHYVHGGALAEKLVCQGHEVHLVTTLPVVSSWTSATDEQYFIQKKLIEMGVIITASHLLVDFVPGLVRLVCSYTGRIKEIACGTLVLVTGRVPNAALYSGLSAQSHGLMTLQLIGDCHAPGLIADAVFSGHRFAREFGSPSVGDVLPRERPSPGPWV